MVISEELHPSVAAIFSKNHPGGAIGAAFKAPQKISDLAICLADMPDLGEGSNTGAHVLITAYGSESGWARSGTGIVVPPHCIKKLGKSDMDEPAVSINGLLVPSTEWIAVPAETEVRAAREKYRKFGSDIGYRYSDNTILAVMDDLELIGVLQVGDLA